jgi:hypothetical protein
MLPTPTEGQARRRAGLILLGIAVAVVAVLAGLTATVIAHDASGSSSVVATSPGVAPAPPPGHDDETVATQEALAIRPMLQLPAQSAQPASR